jgi:hypothetical protein
LGIRKAMRKPSVRISGVPAEMNRELLNSNQNKHVRWDNIKIKLKAPGWMLNGFTWHRFYDMLAIP